MRKRYDELSTSALQGKMIGRVLQLGLAFSITIEEFEPYERESVNPRTFHTTRACTGLITQDSFVKREDIRILNASTPYRLKIVPNRPDGADNKIERVTAVSIKTPKGDFVELDHWTDDATSDDRVLAFLDPEKQEGLEELRRPCPLFGDVDKRFLLVKIKIEVTFEGLSEPAISEQLILCRVVGRHRRLLCQRAARFVQKSMGKLPPGVRKIGRKAIRFVKIPARRLLGLV